MHLVKTLFLILTISLLSVSPQISFAQTVESHGLCETPHPYGEMWALLEKTFLKVPVLTVRICVDEETAAQLRVFVEKGSLTPEITEEIVQTVVGTPRSTILVKFHRNVPLDAFLEGSLEDLEKAKDVGMISEEVFLELKENIAKWFSPLNGRGLIKNDLLIYELKENSVETRALTGSGRELMNITVPSTTFSNAILSGYMIPGSQLRERLIRSLYE